MSVFHLPDLGEGLASAILHTWHVKAGDEVSEDQPLLSVETAKAVVEIPSPQSGHIDTLKVEEGIEIKVGAPLLAFKSKDHKPATVAGTLMQGDDISEDIPPQKSIGIPPKENIMPAARALAKALAIDTSSIVGSGPNGSIGLNDLAPYMQQKPALDPVLSGHRRHMAYQMSQAASGVVPATLFDTLTFETLPSSLTLMLIRACTEACKQVPELNTHYKAHERYVQLKTVDLALAVNSPHGLFTPVLKDVDDLSNAKCLEQIASFKCKANANAFAPEELNGFSFTLSNIGSIGGTFGTPVIIPPSVGILSVGKMTKHLAFDKDKNICEQYQLPLSLSFDHRVVTGAEAATFLVCFQESFIKETEKTFKTSFI